MRWNEVWNLFFGGNFDYLGDWNFLDNWYFDFFFDVFDDDLGNFFNFWSIDIFD